MDLAADRAKLRPVQDEPFNAETPLSALVEATTPVDEFYVRNHFPVPELDPDDWMLVLSGAVGDPQVLRLEDLRALEQHEAHVTLECAGNGRTLMQPFPGGTPWEWGAAGHAVFRGVRLRDVLEMARPDADAVEVLAIGADEGEIDGVNVPFARSLPIAKALDPDTLIAWEMNGEPLTPDHGHPVRLVVPGWYAVSSVKWLIELAVRTSRFEGVFQASHYRYVGEGDHSEGAPTRDIRVRALIGLPLDGAELSLAPIEVAGTAWSQRDGVDRVDVSVDGGETWDAAQVTAPQERYGPAVWRYAWQPEASGTYELAVRATGSDGGAQPTEPTWNQRGYGNNVVHRITVTVA